MFGFAGSFLLWLAFAAAAVVQPEVLTDAWVWVNDLHVVLRVIVWVLLLPFMLGLLVWEQDWPLAGRVALIVLIALVHLAVFAPKRGMASRGRERRRSRSRS
jgi:hypothetical protein